MFERTIWFASPCVVLTSDALIQIFDLLWDIETNELSPILWLMHKRTSDPDSMDSLELLLRFADVIKRQDPY